MGGGQSNSAANAEAQRRRALVEADRRRQEVEARMRHQQERDRQMAATAALLASNNPSMMQQAPPASSSSSASGSFTGPPLTMPSHLLQHQSPQFRAQHEMQQQQALMRLQMLMRNAMSQQQLPQVPTVQAVTEGRTISNECAVNTYSLKFDKATSRLDFSVVNTVPCEVEVHVAVRLDVYQGIVFATPNRQRAPPRRVSIDEAHEEGVPLSFVLDEKYEDIPESERCYQHSQPKAFPVVISVLYQCDPSNSPNAQAAAAAASAAKRKAAGESVGAAPMVANPQEVLQAKKKNDAAGAAKFDEVEAREKVYARRAEHTCLALDPSLKMVKQLFELEGGTYLVEHLFGGEQEARVIDEDANAATGVAASSPSSSSPVVATANGSVVAASSASAAFNSVETDDDNTCVICLTEDRDTAVMPCRHLCLCKGCADELRKHTPKCPVCRGPIQQLLAMKKRK